jgi:hypothetical protein
MQLSSLDGVIDGVSGYPHALGDLPNSHRSVAHRNPLPLILNRFGTNALAAIFRPRLARATSSDVFSWWHHEHAGAKFASSSVPPLQSATVCSIS